MTRVSRDCRLKVRTWFLIFLSISMSYRTKELRTFGVLVTLEKAKLQEI